MRGGAPIGTFPTAAAASAHTENLTPRLITKKYRDDLFEMNKYDEILFHIFNGNDILDNLPFNNHEEIIRLINFIGEKYPTENKYYFIICISFCFTNSPCDIIEYLIYKLGLDRLIEIVYEINYECLFDQIIYHYQGCPKEVIKLDERIIHIKRNLILHKLLEYYSKKPPQDFEELLMKLFLIQNNSFMSLETLKTLINLDKEFKEFKEFKLFEFLLKNKRKLNNFIILLKQKYGELQRRQRKKILTIEQQSDLFCDI